ncbi:unnamed protein product [Effrenium voratum]|nr:unnamed protein product [Effrenium voratum]
MVSMSPKSLQAGVQQVVDCGIVGLALLPEGVSAGHVQVLTPHGLLSCPQDMLGEKDKDIKSPASADAFLHAACEFFEAGQEDQATALCGRAFSQLGAQPMLAAVERRTQQLLDGSGTDSRQVLSGKAQAFEQWLRFLHKAGIWIRMGNAPNITAAQQKVAEACERIAACRQMREFQDRAPEVFASAIHNALDRGADPPADEESEYYGSPGSCERLLSSLAEYPRTLPFGSGGAWDAVVFVQGASCAFLEAALDRRSQLLAAYPTALPPPDASQRYFANSVRALSGQGSSWLMAPSVQRALEDIRVLSLEVLPVRQRLPLLDAQALRVVEGLQQLCRSSLRAAHASFGDLHGAEMAKLRPEILNHLADAEASLLENAKLGQRRTLLLAEEFEDTEIFVRLAADADLPRLDEQMSKSEPFRQHAFAQCLKQPRLHPLFFRLIRAFPPSKEVLEELMLPYPELRWTLELNGVREAPRGQWSTALRAVREIASKNSDRGGKSTAKAMKALAAIAARAEDTAPVVSLGHR